MSERLGPPVENTIAEALDIQTIELTPDRVVMEMEVGPRTVQPMGLLHGGASAVLAESAASMGAYVSCDTDREYAVGIDLNISHLRAKNAGMVRATASPIRKGRSIQVWGIDIADEDEKLVAVARCTIAVRPIGAEA
jgi:1,4-dihydroxy-2-naphthoyl-CoA hydrolase